MKWLHPIAIISTKLKSPAAGRRSRSQIWVMTFLGGLLAVQLGGCGHGYISRTIDTTDGQLKLDSEVALVRTTEKNLIALKSITRVSDRIVVYDVLDKSIPQSWNLTIRLAPDEYLIKADECYGSQNVLGDYTSYGCAVIDHAFQLEAGHIYLVVGSTAEEGWFSWTKKATLTARFEDTTAETILYEAQVFALPPTPFFGYELPPYDRVSTLREKWRSLCNRALAGDGSASSAVASHFRYGWQPVQKDLVKAYLWYTSALDQGYSDAVNYWEELRNEMTPTQISDADRLIEKWEPKLAECEIETVTTPG